MIKRTFVLFFCLVQLLASSLLSVQTEACYGLETGVGRLTPPIFSAGNVQQDPFTCEDVCHENTPIIQAHDNDFEWKENLSDLLRHRSSSYRFITFDSVTSTYFQFATDFRISHKSVQSNYLFKAVSTLPDYYSFLHRLCPF